MGQGSAHGSAPVDDDDDGSSVEEMSPVKAKKPSRRASMAKEKEPPKTGQWRKRSRYAKLGAMCQKIARKETI
ncbi:hypothetical protein Tco_0834425 [Tanacetum coccineum]